MMAMVSRGDRIVVLWPEYFDSTIPRTKGRRVSKKNAVPHAKLDQLIAAAKDLELDYVVEKKCSHPIRWWKKSGRLLVRKVQKKSRILKRVGARMAYNHQGPKKKE